MPFKNYDVEDSLDEELPVIVSVSWGDGDRNSIAYATALNENGVLIDFLKMPSLVDRENSRDVESLIQFVVQHKPEAIVVGGFKTNTKSILYRSILMERVEPEARIRDHKWKSDIPILFVEDDFARIYMNSKRGLLDFPDKDYPMLIRYCVALARKTQNPTLAYASLFNSDEDFRAIRLHPLQNLIPEDTFKSSVERAFLNG